MDETLAIKASSALVTVGAGVVVGDALPSWAYTVTPITAEIIRMTATTIEITNNFFFRNIFSPLQAIIKMCNSGLVLHLLKDIL
jgi:hypothetical protein